MHSFNHERWRISFYDEKTLNFRIVYNDLLIHLCIEFHKLKLRENWYFNSMNQIFRFILMNCCIWSRITSRNSLIENIIRLNKIATIIERKVVLIINMKFHSRSTYSWILLSTYLTYKSTILILRISLTFIVFLIKQILTCISDQRVRLNFLKL